MSQHSRAKGKRNFYKPSTKRTDKGARQAGDKQRDLPKMREGELAAVEYLKRRKAS